MTTIKPKFIKKTIIGIFSILLSNPAFCWDWGITGARVTYIEATFMPSFIAFQTDLGSGACPSGSTLIWWGQGADPATQRENVKAVYATLLAAKISGQTINIYGENMLSGTACVGRFLHIQ